MENEKLIDLVTKISKNRDERAFSELFDFLAPKINAYYLKNNLSFEQSEELTQEVLSTIWAKSKLFDPERSKFITWAYTIARNKKIDLYRKTKSKKVGSLILILNLRLHGHKQKKVFLFWAQLMLTILKKIFK